MLGGILVAFAISASKLGAAPDAGSQDRSIPHTPAQAWEATLVRDTIAILRLPTISASDCEERPATVYNGVTWRAVRVVDGSPLTGMRILQLQIASADSAWTLIEYLSAPIGNGEPEEITVTVRARGESVIEAVVTGERMRGTTAAPGDTASRSRVPLAVNPRPLTAPEIGRALRLKSTVIAVCAGQANH